MTDSDLQAAYERNGRNAAATARELGMPVTTLKDRLGRLSLGKVAIASDPVIAGFGVSKVSTLYGADGEAKAQWVQQRPEAAEQEAAFKAAAEALAATLPRLAAIDPPAACNAELATLYTLTDSHVGALCWHREGGADWDLEIAERTLFGCFEQMVNASPRSELGIVNQLGDWMHWDGLEAVTPTSRHLLDADGRFDKLVDVSIRILRRVIDLALTKHQRVHVLLCEGNHDLASSVWLRKMFKALYENEPRVTVDDSALPYYVVQHGTTMLAFHHGHLKKNDALPLLFATQFPAIWGTTTKRYAHCGHRHHVEEKEHSGMTVMQHTTLAARDAYAARGGWHSERAATSITYHARYGQVGRVTVSPEMLEAA